MTSVSTSAVTVITTVEPGLAAIFRRFVAVFLTDWIHTWRYTEGLSHFYRPMHYSAKGDVAIACCPSVRPSVSLSVCDVGGSGSHRLEILETNCTVN